MAYHGYKGKCVGRLMRFLYEYSRRSDEWKFSIKDEMGLVLDQSEKNVIAEFSWCDHVNILFGNKYVIVADVPLFMFRGEWKYLNVVQVEKLNNLLLQDLKRKQLISGISINR